MDSSRRISTPQAFEVPIGLASPDARETSTVWIEDGGSTWTGVTGWAAAAGVVALLLIAMTLGVRSRPQPWPRTVHDGTVRIHASEARCARLDRPVRARVDVDVATSGKVTRAVAGQYLGSIRPCVEVHARSWVFAPQAVPVTLNLDVVIDPR